MWLEVVVHFLVLGFICFYLFSIDIDYSFRHQVNFVLFMIYIVLSLLAIVYFALLPLYLNILILLLIGISLFYYLHQVKQDRFIIDHPNAYLAFYFPITIIIVLSGMSSSLLFPDAYILAVLFATTHAGRKVSLAVSIICMVTIILIAKTEPISFELWVHIILTFIMIMVLPQMHRILYRKSFLKARAKLQAKAGYHE